MTGWSRWWWLLAAASALTAAHAYALRLPWDQATPLVLANHLFAVGLLLGLLWLGGAVGLRLLRAIGVVQELGIESLLFAIGLGLGGLAYLVMACGFLGLLQPWVLAVLLAVLSLVVRAELAELATAVPVRARAWLSQRSELQDGRAPRFAVFLTEVLVVLLVLRALAPPTNWDPLLYHLGGPKELLRLGRLAPLPEIQQANFPFTVQMLYLVGLAFGSDEMPGLMHLAFALLLAFATFSLGRRFFDAQTGWLAAAIALSPTALAVYAPIANIDYGWAYFDFLAVYAFAIWSQSAQQRWLIVAGLMAGLSMGSKYNGGVTFGAIGLGIVFQAACTGRARPMALLPLLSRFCLPAVLVASPWYLKNWLWLGSPVWPIIAPGGMSDTAPGLVQRLNEGRELTDYLLLPLRIYMGGSSEYSWAIPPLLFALVPAYVLVKKHRLVSMLLAFSALHFVIWSQGLHATRYLFPIFPALSLAVAYVLSRAAAAAQLRRGRALIPWLVLVSMVPSASMAVILLAGERPVAQLVGLESRDAFLSRVIPDSVGIRYLNDHRSEVEKVYVIGDPRLFYLAPPAVIDPSMQGWAALAQTHEPSEIGAQLRQAGISHVLLSPGALARAIRSDPGGAAQERLELFHRTSSVYLIEEFSSEHASVYRLLDASNTGTLSSENLQSLRIR